VGGIWGQTRCLGTGRANRGTGTIFGPGDRDFDTSEQTQRPVERSNRAAAPRFGDRHDVRYADQERLTSNFQLSTFNGVTERAHGGRDIGTDTEFGRHHHWAVHGATVGRYLKRHSGTERVELLRKFDYSHSKSELGWTRSF